MPTECSYVHCPYKGSKLRPVKAVVIQVRMGWVDSMGEFYADKDVGYYHQKCYDEGLLTSGNPL